MVVKKQAKTRKRRIRKKNKPAFYPLNFGFMKSVKGRWRKPHGTANKKRKKCRFAGALPKIGYRNPKAVRGMRVEGRSEVLVRNPEELKRLKEKKDVVARIAGSVGAKKRAAMGAQARALGITIVNLRENHPGEKG
ncbi:50S ribosomal protein L32e [Candidatus Micrarchaeota archaeon]|nr:50S ribosomal protein L32e [Candidatus Micrarchaeota archaeon]